jgi:hypothetical protein
MRRAIATLICAVALCAAKSASALSGQWTYYNSGWQGIATTPTTPPYGGDAPFVCGPFNSSNAPGDSDVDCVINDPQAGIQWSIPLYFPKYTGGAQPASVAFYSEGLWVADQEANIWVGPAYGYINLVGSTPEQPGYYGIGQSVTTSAFQWKKYELLGQPVRVPGCGSASDNTCAPGLASFPTAIGSNCSFQLASDTEYLYARGCDGYVYYLDYVSGAWNGTASTQMSAIGYSKYDGRLWGISSDGEPMRLFVGPEISGGGYQGYSSYEWEAVPNDLELSQDPVGGSSNGGGASLYGCNLGQSFFYTPLTTAGCILAIGGATAVVWNIWDTATINTANGSPSQGELNFYQWGTARPSTADQFGTNNGWNQFSFETLVNEPPGESPSFFSGGNYTYPQPGYPPLYQIAEGGTGVVTSGFTDVIWIVTNEGRLWSFSM